MSLAKCLHLLLLLLTTNSLRRQVKVDGGDQTATVTITDVKQRLQNSQESDSCPHELQDGSHALSNCYPSEIYQDICNEQEIHGFLTGTDERSANGGNSGSTISIGKMFMLKSVKKDEAQRLLTAIQTAWGQGQSLLDPICRVFAESNSEIAWILGRTISIPDRQPVAAFDLKSPDFADNERYTPEHIMECALRMVSGGFLEPCEPHDFKTLAYFQTYIAKCDPGQQSFKKLETLGEDEQLQRNMLSENVLNMEVNHSFGNNFNNGSAVGAVLGHLVTSVEGVMTRARITCQDLIKKWVEKDIGFKKLVDQPLVCEGKRGQYLQQLLNTDASHLATRMLTDYSLFLNIYENDVTWTPQGNFPLTARVQVGTKTYIIAMGIIDYGEEYKTLSEVYKSGTTTMLEPRKYQQSFMRIFSENGYLWRGQADE